MGEKLNLNKLKDEIKTRKTHKNTVPSSFGESVGTGATPRDVFLNGLLESYRTGRETVSSTLVKTVDNKVSEKKGETPKLPIQRPVQQQQRPQAINEIEQVDMMPERDDAMYRDMETMKNKTLAETMQNYINAPVIGAPMKNHVPQTGGQLNEVYINEGIKKAVNGYLAESLEPIIQEAFRDSIIEMYSVEKIKEVLRENREMIKGLVVEVIKEIQAKNKAKAQS